MVNNNLNIPKIYIHIYILSSNFTNKEKNDVTSNLAIIVMPNCNLNLVCSKFYWSHLLNLLFPLLLPSIKTAKLSSPNLSAYGVQLLFMKRGGQLIYAGPLGAKSRNLVDFFEVYSSICVFSLMQTYTKSLSSHPHICVQAIPGVPKIRDGYNPAAWMLEVTSTQMEQILGVDFAEYYRQSKLFQ